MPSNPQPQKSRFTNSQIEGMKNTRNNTAIALIPLAIVTFLASLFGTDGNNPIFALCLLATIADGGVFVLSWSILVSRG